MEVSFPMLLGVKLVLTQSLQETTSPDVSRCKGHFFAKAQSCDHLLRGFRLYPPSSVGESCFYSYVYTFTRQQEMQKKKKCFVFFYFGNG